MRYHLTELSALCHRFALSIAAPSLWNSLGELDIRALSSQRPFIRRAGRSVLRRVPAIPWSLAGP